MSEIGRSLKRLYRGAGLQTPKRRLLVSSPIVAALVAGLATGVWYLKRHPEIRRVDAAELEHAIHDASASAVGAALDQLAGPAPDIATAHVADAVIAVTSGTPHPLPPKLRAKGVLEGRADLVIDDAIDETRDAVIRASGDLLLATPHVPELDLATVAGMPPLAKAIDRLPADDDTVSAFLQRGLAAWLHDPALRDLGDLATLSYHREHGAYGVDYRKFRAVERVLGNAGPVFLHADFWVASDRPDHVLVDGARVHALDRPAIGWRDGWGASFVNGVFVPDRIRRGQITIADIMCERDKATRRVMVDLFGPQRMIDEADSEVIARDGTRALVRVELPGDEPFVALVTADKTLRVPPHVRSCREAEAWTFGLTEAEWT